MQRIMMKSKIHRATVTQADLDYVGSVTLDQDHLRSTTSSRADASFEKDRLWLNGKEEEIERDGRLWVCIDALRKWRQEMEQADSGLDKVGPL